MLNFIYYPVSAILWFWHNAFGYVLGQDNGIAWALAVVFLVFTLRALLFKPFVGQVRSMRKMQEFAPEVQKLKAKYGDDRQKMNAELQKLQAQHGVNPLGGCLPVLVQIPVFIGLFHVLRSFNRPFLTPEVNARTGNYVFSPTDVQSFLQAKLFGVPLSSYMTEPAELLSRYGDITRFEIGVVAVPLTIVAGVLTHLTARHSVTRQSETQAANPQAAMMNKVMLYLFPLGVVAGGPFFPLAILLYWLSNNLWTLGQQRVVYKRIDAEEAEKKEAAIAQRQSLGPRPGQKPVRPKKPGSTGTTTPAEAGSGEAGPAEAGSADRGASAAGAAGAGPDSPSGESNGSAPPPSTGSTGSSNGASGGSGGSGTPGMIESRPQARKKTNRKRR